MQQEVDIENLARQIHGLLQEQFAQLEGTTIDGEWFGGGAHKFDSLQSLQIVAMVENHFHIRFQPHELSKANFKNSRALAGLVARYKK